MYQESGPELEAITWNSPAIEPQYGYTSGQPVTYQMPVPAPRLPYSDASVYKDPSHSYGSSSYINSVALRPEPYDNYRYEQLEMPQPPDLTLPPFVQMLANQEKEARPLPPLPLPSRTGGATKSPDTSSTLSHSFQRLSITTDELPRSTPRVVDAKWGEPQEPLPWWEPKSKPSDSSLPGPHFPSPTLTTSSPLQIDHSTRPLTESRTHSNGSSHDFPFPRPSPRTSVDSSRSNTESMMDLTHLVIYPDAERFPQASGGHSDVYQAYLEGKAVAVKVMKAKVRREPGVDHDRQHWHLVKKINREMNLWSRLDHPNVLSFLGFYFFKFPNESPAGDPGQLSLISPWMYNGTARQYVQKHPEADRLAITRGVATGLHHLHKNHIIHGDIKSGNVLMTDTGVPVLADFGLATLAEDDSLGLTNEHVTTTTGTSHGTPRWMAPEFFQHDAESQKPTKETDVWAFGCFVLVPYATSKSDINAMAAIMQRRLPYECPTDQVPYPFARHSELWHLCLHCWAFDPPSRITVPDILQYLRN
ncbi:kinase-like protein [Sistotremastrum niveocremeum HHB9708]|uniref:Kinase-like protein n=1 Tax=Sistotremastrum niveocremeum HHB9708 TaxID=1314777 RepID=A0A164Y222_9AGAM|nr:kinase-like protein [Sistotremastrum niveocremeum HHB9708]